MEEVDSYKFVLTFYFFKTYWDCPSLTTIINYIMETQGRKPQKYHQQEEQVAALVKQGRAGQLLRC